MPERESEWSGTKPGLLRRSEAAASAAVAVVAVAAAHLDLVPVPVVVVVWCGLRNVLSSALCLFGQIVRMLLFVVCSTQTQKTCSRAVPRTHVRIHRHVQC